MTSSNENIFRVTGHLCGEFTGPGEFPTQRPVTRSFDVYFDLRPNKWLSKQSWGWWFETLSCSLWRHRNDWCVYRNSCLEPYTSHVSMLWQKLLIISFLYHNSPTGFRNWLCDIRLLILALMSSAICLSTMMQLLIQVVCWFSLKNPHLFPENPTFSGCNFDISVASMSIFRQYDSIAWVWQKKYNQFR